MSEFGLSGEDFFRDPWKNVRDLLDGEPNRLIADVPPQVASDRRPLPLLALDVGDDLHLLSTKRSGVVVLVDRSNGRVRTGLATPVPPPVVPPGGQSVDMTIVDLHKVFQFPRTEQRYGVALVVGPNHAGLLPLELTSPSTEWRDPEIAKFLDERKKTVAPRPISGAPAGVTLRWTEPQPDAGAEEAKTFVSLQAPRVVLPAETPEAFLEVRFRLPVYATDVFPPREPEEGDDPTRQPVAGVPLSLLLVDSLNGNPTTIHLHVPIYGELEADGDMQLGTGGFDLDLLSVGRLASSPRTYFVYAISGAHMEGPALFGVTHGGVPGA